MLGIIWSFMIILSLVFSLFTNNIENLCNSSLEGMSKAIEIVITTSGAVIFWSGMMKVAQDGGFTELMSKILSPILKKLFPTCFDKKNILNPMCINIISNMLGLGNAATPSGIKAIKEMKKENLLSENLETFLIMNISCIQLAPTFLVALRKSFGSNNPYDIVVKMWISSLIFLVIGIIVIKASYKFKKKEYKCL